MVQHWINNNYKIQILIIFCFVLSLISQFSGQILRDNAYVASNNLVPSNCEEQHTRSSLDNSESIINGQFDTNRGTSENFVQSYSPQIVKLKWNQSKTGLAFQLQQNTTVLDAKLAITSMPSSNYNAWEDLKVITQDENDKKSTTPVIAVDSHGDSHIVWVDYGNIQESGQDPDIIYAKKKIDPDSNEITWIPYDAVVSSAKRLSQSQEPDIFIDNSDMVHIVWSDDGDIDANDNDWDIFYRSKNKLGEWSDTTVISNGTGYGSSLNPKVAVNKSGDIFIVWNDNETTLTTDPDFDIMCRIIFRENGSLSPIYILTDETMVPKNNESLEPDIAVDGDEIFIVWSDNGNISNSGEDQDIILRKWDGKQWCPPLVVSNDINGGESRLPAIDVQNGVIYIAWEDNGNIFNSGFDSDIILKNFSNSQWSKSIVITNHSEDMGFFSTSPALDVDIDGNIHVVWSDDTPYWTGNQHIVYRKWDIATEQWSDYVLISNDPDSGTSEEPCILAKNDTGVEIVWEDNGNIFDGKKCGIDLDIIYRESEFIYPTNLKIHIIPSDSELIINDFWQYPAELDRQIIVNKTWLIDKLNSLINGLENLTGNYLLNFTSETNCSLKIINFEITLTWTPSPPLNLQVLNEDRDHVISHKPTLSWTFLDIDSTIQGGFEIQVGTSPGINDMWSSGPIYSNDEFVEYGGKQLLDNHKYYFRVKVRDNPGAPGAWSSWSPYQNFTMNALPKITKLSPLSGSADDFIDIEWLGLDGNGDNLTYTVDALYDDNWHRLLENTTDTFYRLNTSGVEEAQNVDLKCIGFDGYEYSNEFNPDGSITIIHNKPPEIRFITPPPDNAIANASYLIRWETIDPDKDDTHTVDIYYFEDKNPSLKNQIILNLPDEGKYHWNTTKLKNGNYYIYIKISDGKNSSFKNSDGYILIDHTRDLNPPRVSETIPKPNSVNVSLKQEIRVIFNKQMDSNTLTLENFTVKDSLDRNVNGYINYISSRNEMIFYPAKESLDPGQKYTVIISAKIRDSSGNYLDGNGDFYSEGSTLDNYIWSFSTIPWAGDVAPPYLVSFQPGNFEVDVPVRPIITVIFSEKIDTGNLTNATVFVIDQKGNYVEIDLYYISEQNQNELKISFYEDLKFKTKYIVLITASVRDTTGRGLDGNLNRISEGSPIDDYTWSFTTEAKVIPENNNIEAGLEFINIYLIIIATIIVIIITILIIMKHNHGEKFIINDIFVIYNDGRLLAHQSFENRSNIDESAMGGMLTAIQNFISESFQDQDSEELDEIKYGNLKISLIHGDYIYLAIITTGAKPSRKFNEDMMNLLALIELKFATELHNWDGNMRSIQEIQDLISF